MESKIKHSAHSRRRAWALLRRAIALNPKKNRPVLSWSVFAADLAEAAGGGAAVVEAVRSALSPPSPPPLPLLPEPTAAVGKAIGGAGGGASTRAHQREEETSLATKLLDLCHSNKAFQEAPAAPPVANAAVPAAAPATMVASAAPSEKFQELAGELERKGGGAGTGVRALSGTWRLVFTTSMECNRYLSRTGVYFACCCCCSMLGCSPPACHRFFLLIGCWTTPSPTLTWISWKTRSGS